MVDFSKRVTIIILNLNSYEVTRECIASLRNLKYPNWEVILVDNGSSDESARKLAVEFSQVFIVRNEKNLGFTGGNNAGIREALSRPTDYLLLLNNDTIISPIFLSKLVESAEDDSQIGIVSPKIYYFEPPATLWYAGGIHKLWWSCPKVFGHQQRDVGRYDQPREVSFASGCALLIKVEAVRRIGLLDDLFYLSFEDTDWSIRALKAGYKIVYVPDAVIWHKDSYDTKKNLGKATRDFYHARNSLLLARKHLSYPYWPLFVLSYAKWTAYHTLGYAIRTEFHRIKAFYKGIWSGCVTEIPRSDANVLMSQDRNINVAKSNLD